jgi:two-component system nitrogen regulation response regulator GlnG
VSKILVVDDDRAVLHMTQSALEPTGLEVLTAGDRNASLEQLRTHRPDVVLLDVILPEASGLDIFREMRDIDRRLPIIFITGGGDSTVAIEAMQLGAFDYMAKPLDLPKLVDLVNKAVETRRLMSVPVAVGISDEQQSLGDQFIGRSPKMLNVFKAIGRVASQNVTVLIRGESGTGKELVARAIYQHSRRDDEPFMAVNCAAIPDTLLESELFGHEKGSFTGAERRRIGKFEQCNGGTIFLDEIGDMSHSCRAKSCACSRSSDSSAWAATRRSAPMCASLPPPTAIWRKWSRKVSSVRISCIASMA